MMRKLLLITVGLLVLSACSDIETEKYKPQSVEDTRKKRHGSLMGEEGGFALLGGSSNEEKAAGSSITVNSYLWRATLDTLAFMPLSSADPFGGVVITDWY